VDPIATRVEVLKGVAYLTAFITALRVARNADGVAFLSTIIIVTGAALAVTALLHPAFGAHKLFGLYEPGPDIAERHIAPLLNPNNLAGYLNMAICLALAASVAPEPRAPRPILAATVVVLAAIQVWVASRAGVVTMILGAFLVLFITRIVRLRERRAIVATLSLGSGVAAAVGGALVVLGGSTDAANELLVTEASKLQMFQYVMRMLPSVAAFGCGRGAFESAFPAFRAVSGYRLFKDFGHHTFVYPENFVAQWVLEWGLVGGVLGFLAVAFALRPTVVLARSSTAAGAWAALVALMVQNLADLGTEVPGVCLAGVLCGAIVVAGSSGRQPSWWGQRWGSWTRVVPAAALAAGALAIVSAARGISGELHSDRVALHEAGVGRAVSAQEMHRLARAAMLRHPAEPYLPFITGLRASYVHDESPLPWMAATLERAAVYAPAHLVLARTISSRAPAQARTEYRLAMEQFPDLVGLVVREASQLITGYYDAMELVPDGPPDLIVLDMLGTTIRDRLPATRRRLDLELVSRAPSAPQPVLRAATDAVDDLEAGDSAPWCAGAARITCGDDALAKAARAQALLPHLCEPYALRARIQVSCGQVAAALAELDAASDRVENRVACLEQLEELALRAGDAARVTDALNRVANAGCREATECARDLSWVAAQEQARGNLSRALAILRRAAARVPDDPSILESMALLAARLGLHAEAADTYERLVTLQPAQSKWKTAAQSERRYALTNTLGL